MRPAEEVGQQLGMQWLVLIFNRTLNNKAEMHFVQLTTIDFNK